MELAELALRYYVNRLCSILYPLDTIKERCLYFDKVCFIYYPIFEEDDKVYFHGDSVVTFCHRFCPEEFSSLTRNNIHKCFPIFKSIKTLESMITFRIIKKGEYRRII